MTNAWKALLRSRKFWMALIGVVGGVALYVQGAVTAAELADLITVLAGVVIGAIALEDAAEKRAGNGRR